MKTDLRLTPIREFSRVFRFFLPVFMAVTLFSFIASEQTGDEVISKNIQAHGGLEKLKSVRSIRATAKISQGSFRPAFRQENKRPHKVREETVIHERGALHDY